uniref:Uncharacterized protein n=1 Tax=Arundo donax TaxID=35708 RepID=A0A0A9TUI0_ARUDO
MEFRCLYISLGGRSEITRGERMRDGKNKQEAGGGGGM